MTSRRAVTVVAALLFTSATALAEKPAGDDTVYPEPAGDWAGTARPSMGDDEHGDVAYPGSHVTIGKDAPSPAAGGWLATGDDTAYPVAEPVPGPSRPGERREERLACGCMRR